MQPHPSRWVLLRAGRASLQHVQVLCEGKPVKGGGWRAQLGTSGAPQTCKRKDEEALLAVFRTQLHVPLLDYASQQACLFRACCYHAGTVGRVCAWRGTHF
jgi:hypothetical protein